MKHRYGIRYFDDLERERLIYYNGEYYKMREEFLSGGPYAVPRIEWDPYGPFRMARPVQHPMRYWTDLDYRYQHRVRETVTRFREHYLRQGYTDQIDGLMMTPLGATVEVKQIPVITINFGDKNFNYSVEIDMDKVYRVDYLSNATLSTVIGKIVDVKTLAGVDYRGKDIYYVILTIDCSSDFGSNVRYIDSRDIRYICALNDLQSNTSITNTYIGIEAPDSNDYGGWYNPVTKEYSLFQHGEWITMPEKPTDKPEGKYYSYDMDKMEWVLKDIPPMPSTYRRGQVWTFNDTQGYWELHNMLPRPTGVEYPELTQEPILTMYVHSCNLEESKVTNEQEIYYNIKTRMWDYRPVQPESPDPEHLVYVFDHSQLEWIGVHPNTQTIAEDQAVYYNFDLMRWLIVSTDKPEDVEYPEYYSWVFYPESGQYLYMTKKLTYDCINNAWTLEPDEIFNKPVDQCKNGYFWKYFSYFNKWFQVPISDVSRKLPLNVNGEIANRDYEQPIYGKSNTAIIIDYRPKTFLI